MHTAWTDDETHLVRGISWTDCEQPVLQLLDIGDDAVHVPLIGAELAFTIEPGRHCIGRSVFVGADAVHLAPCASRRLAESGHQCGQCAATDDSRFIHHVHRGGHVPAALRSYVDQPHWLYVATFADGTSKVGTASATRKRARLDEQGAVRASYVAHTADGFAVRTLEDAVTTEAGLPQTKSRRAKASSLARPLPAREVGSAHAGAVLRAREVLAARGADRPPEEWTPPAPHAALLEDVPFGGHEPLPHDLTAGDHRLHVIAMVGSVALVTANDDPARWVADLGDLTGRKLTPGDVHSAEAPQQVSLF
ncbi:DUF2797 domain-containing protein [Kytococcus sedentarius]|uniref:DUF2797 domain-containing protein n=1 Tax=Kytococcus sedentarius TaxID=1276 RepID=UPI003879CE7E